jgi:hypothetical protein
MKKQELTKKLKEANVDYQDCGDRLEKTYEIDTYLDSYRAGFMDESCNYELTEEEYNKNDTARKVWFDFDKFASYRNSNEWIVSSIEYNENEDITGAEYYFSTVSSAGTSCEDYLIGVIELWLEQ